MIVQQQDANRFFLHGFGHRASGFDFLDVGHLSDTMRRCTLALPGFLSEPIYLSRRLSLFLGGALVLIFFGEPAKQLRQALEDG
jgi:hypothetical protein